MERFRDGLRTTVQEHAADGGAELAVLSESFASPTQARLVSELRTRFPKMQWATYDAVSDEQARGSAPGHGTRRRSHARFDRASMILSLDADPLLTDPGDPSARWLR